VSQVLDGLLRSLVLQSVEALADAFDARVCGDLDEDPVPSPIVDEKALDLSDLHTRTPNHGFDGIVLQEPFSISSN